MNYEILNYLLEQVANAPPWKLAATLGALILFLLGAHDNNRH